MSEQAIKDSSKAADIVDPCRLNSASQSRGDDRSVAWVVFSGRADLFWLKIWINELNKVFPRRYGDWLGKWCHSHLLFVHENSSPWKRHYTEETELFVT